MVWEQEYPPLIRNGPPINLLPQRSRFTPHCPQCATRLGCQHFCSAVSMLWCFVSRRDIERSGSLSQFCMQFVIVAIVASAVWWVCVRHPVLFCLTTRSQSLDDTTSLAWVQSSSCSHRPLLTGAHSSPLTLLCTHHHLQLAHNPESQRPGAACAFVLSHSSCILWAIAQGKLYSRDCFLVSQGLDQLWLGQSNELPHHPLATIIPSPVRLETQAGAGDTLFHLRPFLNTLLLSEPEHLLFLFFWVLFKVKVKSLSCVRLFATPRIVAHRIFQARVLAWV